MRDETTLAFGPVGLVGLGLLLLGILRRSRFIALGHVRGPFFQAVAVFGVGNIAENAARPFRGSA